jgi:hypothetical protein
LVVAVFSLHQRPEMILNFAISVIIASRLHHSSDLPISIYWLKDMHVQISSCAQKCKRILLFQHLLGIGKKAYLEDICAVACAIGCLNLMLSWLFRDDALDWWHINGCKYSKLLSLPCELRYSTKQNCKNKIKRKKRNF